VERLYRYAALAPASVLRPLFSTRAIAPPAASYHPLCAPAHSQHPHHRLPSVWRFIGALAGICATRLPLSERVACKHVGDSVGHGRNVRRWNFDERLRMRGRRAGRYPPGGCERRRVKAEAAGLVAGSCLLWTPYPLTRSLQRAWRASAPQHARAYLGITTTSYTAALSLCAPAWARREERRMKARKPMV